MTELVNPVTGHRINTDDESVEFWKSAGYRAESKAPAKKAASKKSTSSKK